MTRPKKMPKTVPHWWPKPVLLTIELVAHRLSMSVRAFAELRKHGKFPEPDCVIDRRPRWSRWKVDEWAKNGCK